MSTGMKPVLQALRTHRRLFILGAVVALLVGIRFADLGSAPFIHDEPKLQLMLDQHLAEHTLPRYGLLGTRGVAYGPTALWFDLPLRMLTDNLGWITAYHVALHCLGLLLVLLAIRSSVGVETALWTSLLIASSPYLFFYGRLTWDNPLLIPLTALTLFCLARLERDATRIGAWVGLGVATGLVFNLHLMALPVIAAAGLVALPIAWKNRKLPRTRIGVLLAPATLALTVTPYLQVVGASLMQGSHAQVSEEGLTEALPDTLLGTGTYLSGAGMEYFLSDAMEPILERLGPFTLGFQLAWVVRVLAWIWIGWSLVRLCLGWLRLRGQEARTLPIVAQFGVAYFLLLLLYYYLVRPYPLHPHYFMSSFWLLPFFAAWMAGESAAFDGPARSPTQARVARLLSRSVLALVALLALANAAFVWTAYGEISRNHGTREPHYSSTRRELERATRRTCQLARRGNYTRALAYLRADGVLDTPFQWLSRHEPECAGITVEYHDGPVSVPPGTLALRISYPRASPRDARLVVRPRSLGRAANPDAR